MVAASTWFSERGLSATALRRWYVEVLLDVVDEEARSDFDERVDTLFRIEIYAEEWGFFFCHAAGASWIRITDVPFVHGRDDHGLLAATPALTNIGQLLRTLETRYALHFHRRHARVSTNVPNSEPAIRRWVESL